MNAVEKEKEIRKGRWTLEEDTKLIAHVRQYGAARWSTLANLAGLKRDGRSFRMRWLNYLHPDIKHGTFTPEEDRLIIELHNKWGNRWSSIAKNLPGRTDNEIKNYWRTQIKKMPPEISSICSWAPASKSKAQIKSVKENLEASSKKKSRDQQTSAIKESYPESSTPNTLNNNCFDTREFHAVHQALLNSQEMHQKLIKESSDMDVESDMIADASAERMVQHSPTFSCCDTREFHDVDQALLNSQEMHQKFINESSDTDVQNDKLADVSAASMVQHSPIFSLCDVTDSPMNVLSDSEYFLWDYNSINLWNLDDDVQNMDK